MIYDVLILGAGPAGLAAAIYAGRNNQSVLLIEKGQDGGQISLTADLETIPARCWKGRAACLFHAHAQQAKNFGVTRALDSIVEANLSGDVKDWWENPIRIAAVRSSSPPVPTIVS